MNFNPFIDLVISILAWYRFVVTAWFIVSFLIYFDIVNSRQLVVQKIMYFLNALVLPALDRIKKVVPTVGGVDFSVLVLYLLITFITNILYTYFYR